MSRQSGKKYYTSKKPGQINGPGELRIIGGKWRSRKISFPAAPGLRPSPSRIRETLFSWLMPTLPGSHCLDLFAGSGALGFEALSRGAESVTMIEQNLQVVKQLLKNKILLKAEGLQVVHQDARIFTTTSESVVKDRFDIVFCDPPFNQGLIEPLLENLHHCGLLNSSAKIYVETEKSLTSLDLPANWELLKEKVTGDVRYRLIKVSEYQLSCGASTL